MFVSVYDVLVSVFIVVWFKNIVPLSCCQCFLSLRYFATLLHQSEVPLVASLEFVSHMEKAVGLVRQSIQEQQNVCTKLQKTICKDTIIFLMHHTHTYRQVQKHSHTTTYSCVSACTGSDVVEPKRTSWFCAGNSPLCLCFLHVWLACSWKGCAAYHLTYDVSRLFFTGLRTLACFLVLCACREPVSTLCVGNCDQLDFLDKSYSCWWKWLFF